MALAGCVNQVLPAFCPICDRAYIFAVSPYNAGLPFPLLNFRPMDLIHPMRAFSVFLSVLLCSAALPVLASPWVDASDLRLRNNLRLLNDSGVLAVPLTAWPVMWADVNAALQTLSDKELTAAQRAAVKELKFELGHHTKRGLKRQFSIGVANARDLLHEPGRVSDETLAITNVLDWDGDAFALKLQANIAREHGNDYDPDLYGSHFAGVWGNWVLGVGAIERWWGPGSQASLILTDNAAPVPALFVRTRGEQQFDTAWLSWLGPWQFETFVGQLESRRDFPETKLTGMRFTFRPLDRLEVGLSRAMQWGGEGRSESPRSFFKSLTSQGENDGDNTGNQLAGFDLRYGFNAWQMPSAVYSQVIGEDEAGYMPAKLMAQFGIESVLWQVDSGSHLAAFFEHTDTMAGGLGGEHPNVGYEHSVYQTGLRHRGRAIAAMYDNDARVVSFGASWQQSDGDLSQLVLSRMDLNRDGSNHGNTVSDGANDVWQLDLFHQRFCFDGRLKLGINQRSADVHTPVSSSQQDIARSTVYAAWDYRF